MKSYHLYRTISEKGFRPYFYVNGVRVSQEKYAAFCRKCIRFDLLYTERLKNGRYRHGMYGYAK